MIEDMQTRNDVSSNLLENEAKITVKEITMSGEVIGAVKLSPEDIELLNSYLDKPQDDRKLIHGPLLYKILEALEGKLYEIKDLKLQKTGYTKDFLLSYEEYDIVVADELVLTLVTTPKQCEFEYRSDGNLILKFDQIISISTQQPQKDRYIPEFNKPTKLTSFVPYGFTDDTTPIHNQLFVELLNDSLDAKKGRAFGNFSEEFSLVSQSRTTGYPLFQTLYLVARFIQLAYMQKGLKLLGDPQHGSQFFRVGKQSEAFKQQNRKKEFENLILPILEKSLSCINHHPTIGFRVD